LAANVNAALQSETQGREGDDAGYEKFPGWMRSTFVGSSSGACSVVQGPLLTSPGGRFNLVPHMEYSLAHLLFSLYTVQQLVLSCHIIILHRFLVLTCEISRRLSWRLVEEQGNRRDYTSP
jgi:hypothetical protein